MKQQPAKKDALWRKHAAEIDQVRWRRHHSVSGTFIAILALIPGIDELIARRRATLDTCRDVRQAQENVALSERHHAEEEQFAAKYEAVDEKGCRLSRRTPSTRRLSRPAGPLDQDPEIYLSTWTGPWTKSLTALG